MNLLRLDEAPEDPIRRIMYLSGVQQKALDELEDAFAHAYYEARLEGRLPQAVKAGPYAMKRVLRFTRGVNQSSGRMVRWADGLDPTSR